MKKLYWKAFGVHFFAMFLFLSTVLFPLMALADKIAGDPVHVWERMVPFVLASLVFAWVWVANVAAGRDDYDREWQLKAITRGGLAMFARSSPIGWVAWFIARLAHRLDFDNEQIPEK